eukprot:1171155-Amphidinium_carterae.1
MQGDDVAELRPCKICQLALPLAEYARDEKSGKIRGGKCKSCPNAAEALQRILGAKWKTQYKPRYTKLRTDKERLRGPILALARDPNQTRAHPELDEGAARRASTIQPLQH